MGVHSMLMWSGLFLNGEGRSLGRGDGIASGGSMLAIAVLMISEAG